VLRGSAILGLFTLMYFFAIDDDVARGGDREFSEKSRSGLFHWLRPDAASQPRGADSPPERAPHHDGTSGETGAAGAYSANLR